MEPRNILYAHTIEDSSPSEWQTLADHTKNVSELCSEFASEFGCKNWGRVVGIEHDRGKASAQFQQRLLGKKESVDHKTAGTQWVIDNYRLPGLLANAGCLMAYVIAGHHGGMPDCFFGETSKRKSMNELLHCNYPDANAFDKLMCDERITVPTSDDLEPMPYVASLQQVPKEQCLYAAAFATPVFCRFLFSCLVDADYLDTENVMSPEVALLRRHRFASIKELLAMLEAYMKQLQSSSSLTPVNQARASVLGDCIEAAQWNRGLFTLTVPTGGGKTLSSLMFALRHAAYYGMKRIIFSIPFTSIVEQTADVLRGVFGDDNVLEHHSSYDFESLNEEKGLEQRLAIQNWEAPIIVTTNVQLLESLFASKPGKCRKLHNLVNSVIILDEAQSIPDSLMKPTLAMFESMVLSYGASIVLCTATQPALDGEWPFHSEPREIVTHREVFDRAFSLRVTYDVLGNIERTSLLDLLCKEQQTLCIVGTKQKARALYQELAQIYEDQRVQSNEFIFHLSANMTPDHRGEVLSLVRERLNAGQRVIVISTQLVEAGVDIDFPVVYREMAGIDSILQAAGRCNRNGERKDDDGNLINGNVYIFELKQDDQDKTSEVAIVRNWLEQMKLIAREIIKSNGNVMDESLVKLFFKRRYAQSDLDAQKLYSDLTDINLIRKPLGNLKFESYEQRYRLIEDDTVPLFVPRGEKARELLHELLQNEHDKVKTANMVMRLQRFSVAVPRYLAQKYDKEGLIKHYGPVAVIPVKEDGVVCYDETVGLLDPGEEVMLPMVF